MKQRKYRIVIVENDEDEVFFMREAFDASEHFEILAILENGDALFAWIDRHTGELPDLILTDLNMHGKNGYGILADIKKDPIWSAIPVVVTSTSTQESVKERCLALGALGYLTKPDIFLNYGPFVTRLYELIGNSAEEDEAINRS